VPRFAWGAIIMNILFDIGHPAHVHLFKNFIKYLKKKKHNVVTVCRNKDVTTKLLDFYEIRYFCLSEPGNNLIGMLKELLIRDYKVFKLHNNQNFNLAFGTSLSIAHLSALTKVKSINFNEDDDSVVLYYAYLTYPFTTTIVNPDCIKFKKWHNKRLFVPSYHELAYLHPNNFKPNKEVLKKYRLEEKKYIIIRFSALKAHHDTKAKGISNSLWTNLNVLISKYKYKVIKSIENSNYCEIEPWDMHHILAFAKIIISDSQTMTIEGAVLGIPSIRINTFIGKSTVIEELEKKYKLAIGFLPNQEEDVLLTIKAILSDQKIDSLWKERLEKLLREKDDLNKWMIEYFNKLNLDYE